MITVEQLKLSLGHTREDLTKAVCKRLGIKDAGRCPAYEIIRRSIDARKKPDIFFVYSVAITAADFSLPRRADKRYVKLTKGDNYHFPAEKQSHGNTPPLKADKKAYRPIVAGFGPAGMFCALYLARAGFRPIVLERGKAVDERLRDVDSFFEGGELNENSNVQFGEGGAGTFSDGKLNTGVGSQGGRSRAVLSTFAQHGAGEEILFDNKPHIGTDVLVNVVKSIREEIIKLGGELCFNSCLTDIEISREGGVQAARFRDLQTGELKELAADTVCLAIGHSARDTFEWLYKKKIPMQSKAFAVGVRIEHPQGLIDRNMYGEEHERLRSEYGLPAADYKLTAHTAEGRGVYSFCMCPGGYVVNSSSEKGMTAVNGMSYHARDGANANSALIVTVSGKDFGEGVLDGVSFQQELERAAFKEGGGKVPVQLLEDFVKGRVSSSFKDIEPCIKGDYAFGNLRNVLPDFISASVIECMEQFNKKIPGFNMPGACLSGVESRTSSPLRILRDENKMSDIKGFFPCGEGAGYAGGIMSSAVDGIRCAESIAAFYSPT